MNHEVMRSTELKEVPGKNNTVLTDYKCVDIWAASWQNQQNDCAPSEDSDQPGHLPSLIRVFAVRMNKAWVLSYPLSTQQRFWSDWADVLADLSLHWAHMPFCWFCHDVAHTVLTDYTCIDICYNHFKYIILQFQITSKCQHNSMNSAHRPPWMIQSGCTCILKMTHQNFWRNVFRLTAQFYLSSSMPSQYP